MRVCVHSLGMASDFDRGHAPFSVPDDVRLDPVEQMAAHIRDELIPDLRSQHDQIARQYAAAALARSNRLLLAMLELRRSEYPDVLGVLLRCMVECWFLGMLCVLAPEEAHGLIRAAHKRQLEKLDEVTWGDVQSVIRQIEVNAKGVNWEVVSRRVGTLLAEQGQLAGKATAISIYESIYRGESLLSVHAGAASLMGHLEEVGSAIVTREVRHEPDDGFSRILAAVPFVGSLASSVAQAFGLSSSEVDRLGDRMPSDWDSS